MPHRSRLIHFTHQNLLQSQNPCAEIEDLVKPEETERKVNACSPYVQDLLAQFTNSANAAGQLNSQVDKEFAGTTAQIVGSAETGISAAVTTANQIIKQVCHSFEQYKKKTISL